MLLSLRLQTLQGGDVMNGWIMLEINQFLYFHFGSIALIDGRSLRHKYFKDYKDYLGK